MSAPAKPHSPPEPPSGLPMNDTNAALESWLTKNALLKGDFGYGLRLPDGSTRGRSYSPVVPETAMENVLRCANDTFQVVASHKQPASRLKWTFQKALLYCLRRKDGIVLALFVDTNEDKVAISDLQLLLNRFLELRLDGTTGR